jgi:hypothetical protein
MLSSLLYLEGSLLSNSTGHTPGGLSTGDTPGVGGSTNTGRQAPSLESLHQLWSSGSKPGIASQLCYQLSASQPVLAHQASPQSPQLAYSSTSLASQKPHPHRCEPLGVPERAAACSDSRQQVALLTLTLFSRQIAQIAQPPNTGS